MQTPCPAQLVLARILALLSLALLGACTRQHEAHLHIYNPLPQPDSVFILFPERAGSDTSHVLIAPSGSPTDVPIHLRGPELILVGRRGTPEPNVLLLNPKDRVQIEILSQGFNITGSEATRRILALRAYIKTLQHEMGVLASSYPTVNQRGTYDSVRALRIAQCDSLLQSARTYLTDFIRAEPYSKAALVALLAEYDAGKPVLPIAQYHEHFTHVVNNLSALYPQSQLVRRITQSLDSLQLGLSLRLAASPLRVGDTIPQLPSPLDSLLQLPGAGSMLIVVQAMRSHVAPPRFYAQRLAPSQQLQLQAVVCHVAPSAPPTAYLYPPGLTDSTRRELPSATAGRLVSSLGIQALPVALLIDRQGVIRGMNFAAAKQDSVTLSPPYL